jgi:hypothetical protein
LQHGQSQAIAVDRDHPPGGGKGQGIATDAATQVGNPGRAAKSVRPMLGDHIRSCLFQRVSEEEQSIGVGELAPGAASENRLLDRSASQPLREPTFELPADLQEGRFFRFRVGRGQ